MNLPPHLDHSQNLNHLHSQIVMNSKTERKNNDLLLLHGTFQVPLSLDTIQQNVA